MDKSLQNFLDCPRQFVNWTESLEAQRSQVQGFIREIQRVAQKWDTTGEVDLSEEGELDELSIRAHNFCVAYREIPKNVPCRWMSSYVYLALQRISQRSYRCTHPHTVCGKDPSLYTTFRPFL